MASEIRNIIFDLGGVILNIDAEITKKKFVDLWNGRAEEAYKEIESNHLLLDFETGRVSTEEFRQGMLKFAAPGTLPQKVDDAWNAMMLDIPMAYLDLLWNLKKHYRTFLLSNTNALHTPTYTAQVYQKTGRDITDFFEQVFYSHKLGMRKPDTDIFEYVLQVNGLKPHETLFIDDAEENIHTAASIGIQTLQLVPPKKLTDVFAFQRKGAPVIRR